jgi:aminoglycoside phosphotransferase (APT) family kinase protein
VVRGVRIWGGYGPAPTFRLRLADNRGLFLKAVYADSNEFSQQAHERELRVYHELAAFITPWAPRFYGAITQDDWRVMLLEDLGPKSAPPWTPAAARSVACGLADFHASALGRELPGWLGTFAEDVANLTWEDVMAETQELRFVAEMADRHADEAGAWLRAAWPLLDRLAQAALSVPGPHTLIHTDIRSDNLRIVQGRLRLFDWPAAEVGFPEFDLAEFAQSVAVEDGPEAEQVARWYATRLPVRAEALDAALAWIAAYFAYHAWRPEVPGLPRLRRFQRQQLAATLRWLAQRLALSEPTWTAALT